jgi:hypothetical protein
MAIGKTYANGKTTAAKPAHSSKGTPCIDIEVQIENGETVTVHLYTSPDSVKYSMEKLARLGYNGVGDPCTQVIGKPCRLSIKIEEYPAGSGKEGAPKYDFVRNDFAPKEVTGDEKSSMIAALEAAARDAGSFPPAEASKPAKPLF